MNNAEPKRRYLNFRQLREKLGLSDRKVRELVHEAWMPDPVELGPRALRWIEAEVDEALAKRAPRRPEPAPEPACLTRGRAARRQREGGCE